MKGPGFKSLNVHFFFFFWLFWVLGGKEEGCGMWDVGRGTWDVGCGGV